MADINTSIGINADASQAIAEMRKLQTATNNLQQAVNDTPIKPRIESAQEVIAREIQATRDRLAREFIDVPVKVDVQTTQQVAGAVAGGGGGEASNASAVASQAALASSASQAAQAVKKVADSKNADAAAAEVDAEYNQKLSKQNREAVNEARDLSRALTAVAKARAAYSTSGGEKAGLELAKAEAALEKQKLDTAREQQKFNELNLEYQTKRKAAIEAANKATEESTKVTTGYRGAVNAVAQAYKEFSQGAAGGLDGIRSISLNLISDLMLIKKTAEAAFDFGQGIQNIVTNMNSAEKTSQMLADALQNVNSATAAGRVEQYQAEIDKLNNTLSLMNEDGVSGLRAIFKTAWDQGIGFKNIKDARSELEKFQAMTRAGESKVNLKNRQEELDKNAFERYKTQETQKIQMLDGEAKIKAQIALDIAELEKKKQYEKNVLDRDALTKLIELRKQLGDKQVDDFRKDEKKKADEAAKQEQERKQKIIDDGRQAEINAMEGINKIDQQYLFDLDKINRQLAEAKDDDERNAIIAMGRARLSQQQKETADYWKDWNDKQKEAADKAKEQARDAAEYQKSLMEEMIGYQKQIVAGFSGLQNSVFPKEAMSYLRQIAGAANKFP